MDKIRWIIFAVVCFGVLGALIVTSDNKSSDVSAVNENAVIKDGPIPDRVYGNPDAKVILIEYGDFQCSGCGGAFPDVLRVKEMYKNDLAFVYRNLPLTSIHPNALAAAAAAEAAGRQDKFFQMHDKLFESQDDWSTVSADERGEVFEGYAREIGLDIEKYRKDLVSDEVKQKIDRDRALARKAGADSTPTFVLNGKKLDDNQWSTYESLNETVRSALSSAGVSLPPKEDSPSAIE